MKEKKGIVEILVKLLKSRTVWASILTVISLVVYLRTGVFLGEVSAESPDVVIAVERVSLILAFLAQLGVPYFRYVGKEMK